MAKTIYEVLSEEHEEARKILEELAGTSENEGGKRRKLGSQVATALISHNEAESQTLYQRLLDFDELREQVEAHQDEHEEANEELRLLLDMDVEDSDWLDKLKEIKQAVEQHIEDEEEVLFPEAKRHLEVSEAEELAERFNEEQSRRKEGLKAA